MALHHIVPAANIRKSVTEAARTRACTKLLTDCARICLAQQYESTVYSVIVPCLALLQKGVNYVQVSYANNMTLLCQAYRVSHIVMLDDACHPLKRNFTYHALCNLLTMD